MLDHDPGTDRSGEEEALRALIAEHEDAFARMIEQLDRTDAAIERLLAHFAEKQEIPMNQ